MTIALRDYQIECLETVISESKSGVSRQLLNLPTGAGKTICMAAIAKHLNKKTLLIAHRQELIEQALDKFLLFWPEVDIGVCMGDQNEIDRQVVIGSVQSCSRPKRLERLKEKGYELLLIDEAHHSTAESYQNVIEALGFKNDPSRLLVGVTATVKQGLDNTFQKITFSRSIATMIKAGYLSGVEGRRILTNLILERIRTQNGDFCLDDLSEAVNTTERNEFIVAKFKEYAAERKAIAFCCDVAHTQALAEAFQKEGFKCAPVWGDMGEDKRKQALRDFKEGRIQILTSCGVLTEGYDEGSINCVLMCRPTKSRSLYIQCVGRGLRLHPGKESCLVLDFTDKGHSLDSVLNLSSAIFDKLGEDSTEERQPGEEIDHTKKILILDEKDERFDILGNTRFCWVDIGEREWSLLDDAKHEIVLRPAENGYIAMLYFPDGSSRQIVKSPLPIEYCMGCAEDFARQNLKIAFADLKAPWMIGLAQPTQGQCDYLTKHGAFKEGMSKAEASLEIRKLIALQNKKRRLLADEPITQMQKYFLKGRGFDITSMTKLQANQAISKIKQSERTHG